MHVTVYNELFDKRFKDVYLEKGTVEPSDMVMPYDQILVFFIASGRGEKAARNAIRELKDALHFFIDNLDGTYTLEYNPHNVQLSDMDLLPGTDTPHIKSRYTVLKENVIDHIYAGTTVIDGRVRNECCHTMQSNIANNNVKLRYGKLSIFGTKIMVCPWCSSPIVYKKE